MKDKWLLSRSPKVTNQIWLHWRFSWFVACVLLITLAGGCQRSTSQPPAVLSVASSTAPRPLVEYKTLDLPQATVHFVKIPLESGYVVMPKVAGDVASVESLARQSGAIAAINGGFFDPTNQKSTSYVTVQGQPVANPRQNEHLMDNPDLAPYLEKILNRSEFRRYSCQGRIQYAIAQHHDPTPEGCQLEDAIGGGPRLLPMDTSIQEGFVAIQNETVVRDAIGSSQPNARSAIGITANGDVVLVMVAQKPKITNSGMTLLQLVKLLQQQGIDQAMNLDGGTSSSLHYQGKTWHGKVGETGDFVSRPVKSVILVQAVK